MLQGHTEARVRLSVETRGKENLRPRDSSGCGRFLAKILKRKMENQTFEYVWMTAQIMMFDISVCISSVCIHKFHKIGLERSTPLA